MNRDFHQETVNTKHSSDSSGVYICKSIVNDLRHGNYICKSEGIHLTYENRIEIPVELYIFKSIVNDLKHGNYICISEEIYLTYEHRIEIPVEFTYVNQ